LRLAHAEFVASFAGNVPLPIRGDTDSEDFDCRAGHLQKVFAALHDSLQGFSANALCIRNAAGQMREHEHWRAS
jgi:hypothetical protein